MTRRAAWLPAAGAMLAGAGILAAAGVLGVAGCAWAPGAAFSEIRGGTLALQLPGPAGRMDEAGRWLTSNGYALAFEGGGLRVGTVSVALVGTAGAGTGAGAARFDPSRPPSGYTLCHAGHCHRTDGALVPYSEVEAELIRGTGGAATTIADLVWDFRGVTISPGAKETRPLGRCDPDCLLGRGTIAGADLRLASVAATGTVEASPGTPPLPGGKRTWTLALTGLDALKGTVVRSVDRDAPASFSLDGTLAISDKLFDGLDWAALASGAGTIDLRASPGAASTLAANYAKSNWSFELKP